MKKFLTYKSRKNSIMSPYTHSVDFTVVHIHRFVLFFLLKCILNYTHLDIKFLKICASKKLDLPTS